MTFLKPTLVTITAPTCSGKTYLIEHLDRVLGFNRIVGFTTRAPRTGEVEGADYNFISIEEAKRLDAEDQLAEIAEFRGNFYGVKNSEMEGKMSLTNPPVVILEPKGLASYEEYCVEKGWNIFKIFVSVPEKTKIDRLNERTALDIQNDISKLDVAKVAFLHKDVIDVIQKNITTHSSRLMSITGDERLWQTKARWEAIVPGDDIIKALQFIKDGIKWQNSRNAELTT